MSDVIVSWYRWFIADLLTPLARTAVFDLVLTSFFSLGCA